MGGQEGTRDGAYGTAGLDFFVSMHAVCIWWVVETYACHLAEKLMAIGDRDDALSVAEIVGGAGEENNVVYWG